MFNLKKTNFGADKSASESSSSTHNLVRRSKSNNETNDKLMILNERDDDPIKRLSTSFTKLENHASFLENKLQEERLVNKNVKKEYQEIENNLANKESLLNESIGENTKLKERVLHLNSEIKTLSNENSNLTKLVEVLRMQIEEEKLNAKNLQEKFTIVISKCVEKLNSYKENQFELADEEIPKVFESKLNQLFDPKVKIIEAQIVSSASVETDGMLIDSSNKTKLDNIAADSKPVAEIKEKDPKLDDIVKDNQILEQIVFKMEEIIMNCESCSKQLQALQN